MRYLSLLNHSYETVKEETNIERCEYLAEYIFEFTTYENVVSSLMAQKCLEVCKAISDRKTFEYIETKEGNLWYLIMVNMPFIADKITWGTSIRGAFWENRIKITSCGLYAGFEQVLELELTVADWIEFIEDMILFAKEV